MSDKELKPCPFCGGEAELNTMGAMCKNKLCGAVVPGFGTTAVLSTIKCWNIRPPTPLVGVDRLTIASMVQEIIHECHKLKEGADMSGLIDKYSAKFGSPQKESLDLDKVLETFDDFSDGGDRGRKGMRPIKLIVGVCYLHRRVICVDVDMMEGGLLRSYTNEKGYCDECLEPEEQKRDGK